MGLLSWGDIVAILGSLASIIGGLRWLLGVYFRQQIKIAAAQKVAFALEAKLLNQEVEKLKMMIRSHREELDSVGKKIELSMKELSNSQSESDRVYASFRDFVVSAKKRFEAIENGGKQDAQETKDNVGKVIVKK